MQQKTILVVEDDKDHLTIAAALLRYYGYSVLEAMNANDGIKLAIEERTAGEISLGSGTLYQAIHRLEREGLIAAAAAAGSRGDPRRGRTYRIEPLGRASLANHLRRLSRAVDYARAHRLLPSTKP